MLTVEFDLDHGALRHAVQGSDRGRRRDRRSDRAHLRHERIRRRRSADEVPLHQIAPGRSESSQLLDAGGIETGYACGPTPMMARCAEIAAGHAVRCFVSLENNMACGFGVCLGCAAPRSSQGYALVCREGPVFEADGIDWAGLP